MTESTPLSTIIAIHRAEAEKMFSGAVMINPEYARESCGWLAPSEFCDERLSRFWEMVKTGSDPAEAAMQNGVYLEVAQNMTRIVSMFDVVAFANAISQDNFLLKSTGTLSEMARAIGERNSEQLRKLAQSILEGAPLKSGGLSNAVDIGMEFQATLDDVGAVIIPTGIIPLDRNMGGYERKTLTVIGGRPGMGKTALGLQSAAEGARCGYRTLYFSLEMSKRDLWARMACGRAGVDWRNVIAKKATPEDIGKLEAATVDLMNELEDRFIVDDNPMMTSEGIFQRVGEVKPDLIVVDHLDLVDRKDRGKVNEVQRVGNISRMGKVIAKQFDIAAVYLVQLNRKLEGRDDKRPTLADLRASGEIEQDADVVMFPHRPDYFEREKRGDMIVECEIWLEKVRNGKAGVKAETMLNLQEQHFYPVDYRGTQTQPQAPRPAKSSRRQPQPPPEPNWEPGEDMEL